jgi:hypothetical protein
MCSRSVPIYFVMFSHRFNCWNQLGRYQKNYFELTEWYPYRNNQYDIPLCVQSDITIATAGCFFIKNPLSRQVGCRCKFRISFEWSNKKLHRLLNMQMISVEAKYFHINVCVIKLPFHDRNRKKIFIILTRCWQNVGKYNREIKVTHSCPLCKEQIIIFLFKHMYVYTLTIWFKSHQSLLYDVVRAGNFVLQSSLMASCMLYCITITTNLIIYQSRCSFGLCATIIICTAIYLFHLVFSFRCSLHNSLIA